MPSRINQLLSDIENKKNELKRAYEAIKQKYDFKFLNGNILFSKKAKLKLKKFKRPFNKMLLHSKLRHWLSMPFIYGMFIIIVLFDITLSIYQQAAFRLYRIPLVKRKDYIIFDRHILPYLNLAEKVNCLYCSYANGIFAYAVEIGGRTEKYRCPIKHAKKESWNHKREKDFSDYGDAEGFREKFNNFEENIQQ